VDFTDAKLRQLDAATAYRVNGHEVAFEQGASARRRWRLIWPCFCVHDSPDSPCPCMEDGPRWWLPADAVLNEGDAGRKGHDGEELHFFDVRLDSQIMVESVQPVHASDVKRLEGAVSPERFRNLMSGFGSRGAGVIAGPTFGELIDYLKKAAKLSFDDIINEMTDALDKTGIFDPIDWQGAAEKWKGRPQ
jgi:hypothetical protein